MSNWKGGRSCVNIYIARVLFYYLTLSHVALLLYLSFSFWKTFTFSLFFSLRILIRPTQTTLCRAGPSTRLVLSAVLSVSSGAGPFLGSSCTCWPVLSLLLIARRAIPREKEQLQEKSLFSTCIAWDGCRICISRGC